MKHGSLFSGIGGFDLASEWMGWENVFHCEIESFPRKILHHYWPNAISYEDIKKTDFTVHKGRIDIITGGFPCQPYSMAGKRKGKEDERHLWPEMLRAIREIQPRWVVGENVFGVINWNGGLVFDEVQSDLEAEGYEVQAYVLPAAAVNAPHRRDRVWFVAYSDSNSEGSSRNSERTFGERCNNNDEPKEWREHAKQHFGYGNVFGNDTDTNNTRLQRSEKPGSIEESRAKPNKQPTRFFQPTWNEFPTVSPVCDGDDGLSNRLDEITFPKWRNESIKGYGNAIVPQVVYQIFKAIKEYESI